MNRTEHRYETGYLVTTVTAASPGKYRWDRTQGSNNPDPFPPIDPKIAAAATSTATRDSQFITPTEASSIYLSWQASGHISVADAILDNPDSPAIRHTVHCMGTSLRYFHQSLNPGTAPLAGAEYALRPLVTSRNVQPPALRRLATWLDGGADSRASAPYRVQLRSHLGGNRWEALRELTEDFGQGRDYAHGWYSLGAIIIADELPLGRGFYVTQTLTGPDFGRTFREYDLGFLLGELAEYAAAAERHGRPREGFDHIANLFTAAYGPHREDRLAAATALRVTLHSRDFAGYMGWYDDLDNYPPLIADLLDTALNPRTLSHTIS